MNNIEEITAALIENGFERKELHLDASENSVSGYISSMSFKGQSQMERQTKLWQLLEDTLTQSALDSVSAILTVTPEEVDGDVVPLRISKSALADLLIQRLNEILQHDPKAMADLIETRVPCNEALANHHSVQVDVSVTPSTVGVLGLLNGIVGTIGEGPRASWGLIAAVFDDDGQLIRFQRTETDG